MKRLLIICKTPYGQLTDIVKWCENLSEDIAIKVVSLKNINDKPLLPKNVQLIEVPLLKLYILRGALFVFISCFLILLHRGTIIVEYFSGCSIFKIFFFWKKIFLDIRTLAVIGTLKERCEYNIQLRKTVCLYDELLVISEGVGNEIGNIDKPIHIIPLGSDVISTAKKDYKKLSLLYVGTLRNRQIDKTIEGIKFFIENHPQVELSYNIIGASDMGEEEICKELVKEYNIEDKVHVLGRVEHHLLQPYFDNASYGVCHIPMTPYYDIQPPTKTYEYSMSGLVTIGTATSENKKIINSDNGVLYNDSPEGFAEALEYVYKNREIFNEITIRSSLKDNLWKNIVSKYLKPII